jgi:murein DD-endopeptidase MepM/ murein hydrolase activator NlpD
VILAAWIAAMVGASISRHGRNRRPSRCRRRSSIGPNSSRRTSCPACRWRTNSTRRCGLPTARARFISLPFLEAGHLGEDWTTAKGDAALGEPVYSVADGWVSVAQDFQNAWGKVVFICYRLPEGRWPPFVEVMYAQLNSIDVKAGQFVKRGQRIGTVGNANGTYQAHLHWEVRQTVGAHADRSPAIRPRRWCARAIPRHAKRPRPSRRATARR